MSNVVKRGNSFRGIVRVVGMKAATKTFPTKPAALAWVAEQKSAMMGRKQFMRGVTLGSIFQRYKRELLEKKDPDLLESHFGVEKRFAIDFAEVELSTMTKKWWIDTVSKWDIKPSSRRRYFYVIVEALEHAEAREWDNCKVDWESCEDAQEWLESERIMEPSDHRERRVSDEEIEMLCNSYVGKTYKRDIVIPMPDIIRFAVITGLRRGEIAKLEWKDILDKDPSAPMLLVRQRKSPKKKIDGKVPLLGESLAILKRQPRDLEDPRIFGVRQAKSISSVFYNLANKVARENPGLCEDLHFHDLRHEAISRLFEQGFTIPEVALVSGHQSWKSLEVYTNLKPDSLHKGPLMLRQQSQWTNQPPPAPKVAALPKLRRVA